MKCNKCHEEMKIKEVEVGKDSAGNPVYNLYAFCYHCKTKVNIDKLKKAAQERKAAEQLAAAKKEAAQREETAKADASKSSTAPVHVSARTQEMPSQSAISHASSPDASDRPKKKSAPKSDKSSSPKKKADPSRSRQSEKPAKKRYREEDFDLDDDDDYDYIQPDKVKSTEKRAVSRKKKGGCLKPVLIFLLILLLAGGAAFAYGTYVGYDFSFLNDIKEKILNHTDGTDEKDKKEDDGNADNTPSDDIVSPDADTTGNSSDAALSGQTDSANGTDSTNGTDGADTNSTDNSGSADAPADNGESAAQ